MTQRIVATVLILLTCSTRLLLGDLGEDPPKGFRFTTNEHTCGVVAHYSGDGGLRSGRLHDLPKLCFIVIGYGVKLTADDLRYLSTLNGIEGIQIGQDLIDDLVTIDGELSPLADLKTLEYVHLCKHNIRDSDLEFISSLPKINQIEFNADSGRAGGESTLSDQCAHSLSQAKTLQSISVQGCGRLTDEFVSTISEGLPRLEHLNIRCPALTDASLKFLATGCPSLKWLDVSSNQLTNQGMQHLSAASQLERLSIESDLLTSRCFESVASLQKLKLLDLTVSSLADDHVRMVAQFKQLETIVCRRAPLSDRQFQMFTHHPCLKSGFLNGDNLSTESTLKVISTMPNLELLIVGRNNVVLQTAVNRALEAKRNSRVD